MAGATVTQSRGLRDPHRGQVSELGGGAGARTVGSARTELTAPAAVAALVSRVQMRAAGSRD